MSSAMQDILRRAPVVPVIVIHDLAHAVPLAEALLAGGLAVLEVTLRTEAGLPAIEAMRRCVPEAIVGVGTLTSPEHFAAARDAGAQFGVSPGLTAALAAAGRETDWPYLPGVMTPSELMRARELGFDCCKLFPAQQAGGVDMLRAIHSILPDMLICPTGGINAQNAARYLTLPNVPCVGGSWVAPPELMRVGNWKGITQLAAEAVALKLVDSAPR